MSSKFRYLISPDGSIRVCTQAKVTPADTDFVHESTQYYPPGQYMWDFNQGKMGEIPEGVKAARHAERTAEQVREGNQKQEDLRKLKKKLKKQTVEFREMFVLLAKIVGVDISE